MSLERDKDYVLVKVENEKDIGVERGFFALQQEAVQELLDEKKLFENDGILYAPKWRKE